MIKIDVINLNIWFGNIYAIENLNIQVFKNEILTIIGPANSGKTTFLRMLNRLNELESNFKMEGLIKLDENNIMEMSQEELRSKVGMVFALPTPLPLSIFDNVVYGLKIKGIRNRKKLEELAEIALKEAYLWDEVKDRLHTQAVKLSGGQQQRLCIARVLAIRPEVILFDEPCSGLDPISTAKVEEAMLKLKKDYTIILVTNNVKQAARIGDRTAFFLNGKLIEVDKTEKIFTSPSNPKTDDYIRGKFG